MKVGILAGNPFQEWREAAIFAQGAGIIADRGQFLVGELDVQGAVADGMHALRFAPTARLGDGVMIFDPPPERTLA